MKKRPATILPVFLVCLLISVTAKTEDVPCKLKWAILFKVLGYDHNLTERCKEAVRVGVVSSSSDTSEAKMDLDQIKAAGDNTIRKLKIEGIAVFVKSTDKALDEIREQKINVVYLATSAERFVPSVAKFCSENKIVLFGATEPLVKQGAAVAIVRRGNKPKILMNVVTAKSQGAEFDFRLIRLAEVVQ